MSETRTVPVEPTEEMIDVGARTGVGAYHDMVHWVHIAGRIYGAMLAAAPQPDLADQSAGKVLSEEEMGVGYDRKAGDVIWWNKPKGPCLIYAAPQPNDAANARAVLNSIPAITDPAAIEILERLAEPNDAVLDAQSRQARGDGISGDAITAHPETNAATPLPLTVEQIEEYLLKPFLKPFVIAACKQALRAIELEADNLVLTMQLHDFRETEAAGAAELQRMSAELARYREAERELPEEQWQSLSEEQSDILCVDREHYFKLRTFATAAVARAEKVRAETIEECAKACLDEAEHIRLNAERLRKFVDSEHEARCMELCAMYLTEFANNIRALAAVKKR